MTATHSEKYIFIETVEDNFFFLNKRRHFIAAIILQSERIFFYILEPMFKINKLFKIK